MPGVGGSGADLKREAAVFGPPDALRPQHSKCCAVHVEVHQGEDRAQPVMVLRDPSVSLLVESEDAFQDPENMFCFGSYSRLSRVLASGFFVDIVLELRPAAGHVLSVRRCLAD